MRKKIYIKLDNPCFQNWEEMLATDEGRFCQSCQKGVMDFTGLSDMEIYSQFQSANNSLCGRFYKSQLEHGIEIELPAYRRNYLPKVMASIILIPVFCTHIKGEVLFPSKNDSAYVVIDSGKAKYSPKNIHSRKQLYRIFGQVRDSKSKQSLTGVLITISNFNRNLSFTSDSHGNFSIDLPFKYSKMNFKVLFSCIGYNTLTVKMKNKKETFNTSLNIFMHPAEDILNKVIIVGGGYISD